MAIPEQKRKFLIEKWGMPEDALKSLETTNELTASSAKELGLESKESETVEQSAEPTAEATEAPAAESTAVETPVTETPAETPAENPQDGFPTRKEVAEAVVNIIVPVIEKQNETIEHILKQMTDLQSRLNSMEKTDEEKITNIAKETPMASLSALITQSIIGNPATEVGKRDKQLSDSKPKETEAQVERRTGIPLLDSLMTPVAKQ